MQEEDNNNSLPAQVPATKVRVTREKISQKVIDELNERHDRIMRSASDIAREIIELGEMLIEVKSKMRHGKWLPFVERNLRYSMRTVQRYMRSAEQKYDPLLGLDPAAFMAKIWGNNPKQLEEGKEVKKGKNDVTSHLDKDDGDSGDDSEDLSQHGGPGLNLFPDKGKAGFFIFRNLVGLFEQFFGSKDYTLEAKLTLATQLSKWFETKRNNLSGEQTRKLEERGESEKGNPEQE